MLVLWPAALTLESALPLPPVGTVVHVAIKPARTVVAVPGVRAHRTAGFDDRIDWNRRPPRMRVDHALVDVASRRRDDLLAMFRVLCDVTQTRQTTAARVARVLSTRRVAGKRLLLELPDDLATGACSVLEREYLNRVERAHGLPEGQRQALGRSGAKKTSRDVVYVLYQLLVELDGLAFHNSAQARDDDANRDLDARVDDDLTSVRITYGLVFGTPCRTADRIATLLQLGGWQTSRADVPTASAQLDVGS